MPDNMQWPGLCKNETTKDRLKNANVLAVGAGGIGCELLKTLVLSGFENIEVIDMDTIETSNLNRQFLFRKRHVGESKAVVAAEAVQKFRPSARIKAHQANIKEQRFGVDFFKSFDIVLNGLDNLEARRHVNRLCLASRTPLVESGTAGYLGQVSVHLRLADEQGNATLSSECFECQPKAAPKSYPVCTIRNTPDKPIHCIVWAKDLLFQRLFGSPEATSDLDEKTAGEREHGEQAEANGQTRDDTSDFLQKPEESEKAFAARILERVYNKDIETLLSMEDMWKTRRKPESIKQLTGIETQDSLDALQKLGNTQFTSSATASSVLDYKDSHKPWDMLQNIQVFLLSIVLFLTTRQKDVGSAVFDKDDELAVEFVTAASNLRSFCYHIPPQSLFEAKGMAGNIIHAIATTNATIAGMIVVEATKILTGCHKQCKNPEGFAAVWRMLIAQKEADGQLLVVQAIVCILVSEEREASIMLSRLKAKLLQMSYLQQIVSGKRLITAMDLAEPSPSCIVCGTAQLQLTIDTAKTPLQDFVEKVLKKRLSMNEPTIMAGNFAYEEGADLEPDEVEANAKLLPTALDDLPGGGLKHGTIVSVSDQAQDFTCQLVISHRGEWDEEKEPEGFLLVGAVPSAQQTGLGNGQAAGGEQAEEDSDDDIELIDDNTDERPKRKRDGEQDSNLSSKRQAVQQAADGVVSID